MSRLKNKEHRTFIHVCHKLTDFSKTRCTTSTEMGLKDKIP
jgi:hypothetical protein